MRTTAETCELREANGIHGQACDGGECPYWRAVGHLGESEGSGCALKHYELLGDAQMAKWLLSVRERMLSQTTQV